MAETIATLPFWVVEFDENGNTVNAGAISVFLQEVASRNLTDLFAFSHGWNNDRARAMSIYRGFFTEMTRLLDALGPAQLRPATVGLAGVIWPSIKWPDSEPGESEGGAASLGDDDEEDLFEELQKVFVTPKQQATLAELAILLGEQPRRESALREFKTKLHELVAGDVPSPTSPDNLELRGIAETDSDWREVFEALADQDLPESAGGPAGLGDEFGRLWVGAKAALRVTTYWQMKARAGVVGQQGLGPLVGRLQQAVPALRVHLLGHSFGARLVSYALPGLPPVAPGQRSPVKSLFLLQGAFSHFAFADQLPFDRNRKGDLAGMASRVDGPLLTTYSEKDTAVGTAYPLSSVVARQDASALLADRWGAMGHDGAQAVNAVTKALAQPGTRYPFEAGKWLNLDGNDVIVNGGPPSGSHSDIIHPHTAWAALAAAGIC